MKIAMGQFAVRPVWEDNARVCLDLMRRAAEAGADLLVLPEGILARDIADPDLVRRAAQPLDGPFMTQLQALSRGLDLTVIMTVHTPAAGERVWNTQVALRRGEIVAQYRKLHLYDAFSMQESVNVVPGDEVPPLVSVAGMRVGMMTCYDLRFPELARRLALDGADVLVVPSAWVKGPLKEAHWSVLSTARALENTCYVAAVGECGPRNIGASLVVDPLGVAIAQAGEQEALVFADLDPARIAHARDVLPVLKNRRFARPELA
ncbi:deaminated glutathione amidase [Achromobacter ruhlandii]|uniref:deaminated glutathione amidase n=1 Tax=Achromobacter ruhlandii TaxID=72557 RepID=UPI001EEEACD7|nr:deaminated glutathione amidase [Achromobacter ruhlandii]MCZ8399354.1 deaminated glutathione amidase [Achromobacter ruhlandii]